MTAADPDAALRRATGGLFVAGALAFGVAATALSSTFDWPDVAGTRRRGAAGRRRRRDRPRVDLVRHRLDPADLASMGAITGLVLGPAQAMALPRSVRPRWAWAVAMPVLWALGWTATTLGGISVDEQFTVVGAYGALTTSALSGLLLLVLLPHRPTAGSPPAGTAVQARA